MENDKILEQPNEAQNTSMETDYIEAIKNLKNSSVSKADYDALRLENKKLLDAVVNGQPVEQGVKDEPVDIGELRKKVFDNPDQTNLDYITNALKLREAILEKDGVDIFVPQSSQYSPTQQDFATAEKVARVFQEMVDTADGDPNVFLNEYQRRVKEDNIPTRAKK